MTQAELPWLEVAPCRDDAFTALRREVIFAGAKWDPQIGDTTTISRVPIVLRPEAWEELVRLATALSRELRALERAVLEDEGALRMLGLDRETARALHGAPDARAIPFERFDFHYTRDGWKISEVNADVPGGLHEGIVGGLYAQRWPGTRALGDVADAIASAFARRCPGGASIALVHATAYSDDRQVISLLERALERAGLNGIPCAPDHVRFRPARVCLGPDDRPIAGLYRFFPAEWLKGLPRDAEPRGFVRPDVVSCNPATALAVQSKRLPLVWDRLGVPVPTFRAVLAETRAIDDASLLERDAWLVKPAFGRVGGGIVGRGASKTRALITGLVAAALSPRSFVAQRRFHTVPFRCGDQERTACIGVFTLDGKVVGAYGRSTPRAFVDHLAMDTPVLVSEEDRS